MNASQRTIRVLIADDHPVTRQGIRAILEGAPDIEIVGEAKDGLEAKKMVTELNPDVLLLDLVMPGLPAREVDAWVRANCPATVTLILTGHTRDEYLTKAIDGGAAGFLTKKEAPHKLVETIRHAARGEILISGRQIAQADRWRREVGERWESLTERERQILRLIADGKTNQQIAQELTISECTVETHIGNLLGKLGVASRTRAAAWVWRHGLVEEPDAHG